MGDGTRPLVTLKRGLVAGLALVWTLLGGAAAQTDPGSEAQAAQLGAQLRNALRAIEDGQVEAARDRWDPQYVVDQIGVEPELLIAWVRGSVRWAPYRGALRGASGVLMDRTGNSLDIALLTATLLRAAGNEVRLAHAKLPEAIVAQEYDRLQIVSGSTVAAAGPANAQPLPSSPTATAAPSPASAGEVSQTTLAEVAQTYDLDAKAAGDRLTRSVSAAVRAQDEMSVMVELQSAALRRLTGHAEHPETAAALVARAKDALADHWWVQYRSGGAWVDADPLAAGSAVGARLTVASATYPLEQLPAEAESRVTIRVVAEQWKDGAAQERVALEHTLRPRDVMGQRLSLFHYPMAWPSDWTEMTPDDVQIKLRAALYTQKEWMPVLTIGRDNLSQLSVKDTGEVNDKPSPVNPFAKMTVPVVGQIMKATDTLITLADPNAKVAEPDGDAPRPPRPEGELSAEWIEFEIAQPGLPVHKVRRELFDLRGAAARQRAEKTFMMTKDLALRRSMAQLEETHLLVQNTRLHGDFLMHLTSENVLANKPLIDEMAADPFGRLPANYVATFAKLTPFPAALFTTASLRLEASPVADVVYVDRPAVIAQHTTLSRRNDGDFLTAVAIDFVDNGVGVRPEAAGVAGFVRLVQGVADTNAEAIAAQLAGHVSVNTAVSFRPFALGDWTVLRPDESARLAGLGLPADVSARLAADLQAGRLVVVPNRADLLATAGWWRIDPATGGTLGVGPNGYGAALVEYAFVLILQGIIGAAQCALAQSGIAAIEKTWETHSVREGYKAGVDQAGKSLDKFKANPGRCVAAGLMGGIDAMLMMFSFQAAQAISAQAAFESQQTRQFQRMQKEAEQQKQQLRQEAERARQEAQRQAQQEAKQREYAAQQQQKAINELYERQAQRAREAEQRQQARDAEFRRMQQEWDDRLNRSKQEMSKLTEPQQLEKLADMRKQIRDIEGRMKDLDAGSDSYRRLEQERRQLSQEQMIRGTEYAGDVRTPEGRARFQRFSEINRDSPPPGTPPPGAQPALSGPMASPMGTSVAAPVGATPQSAGLGAMSTQLDVLGSTFGLPATP